MSAAALFTMPSRLPVILQSERSECGLACLAMIAGYHGHGTDLNELRRTHSVSGGGATVAQLMRAARSLSLAPRALRLEPEELAGLQLPAILHWNLDHFVVLRKLGRRGACVHDPAVGQRWYSMRELADRFTGIALELTPAASFRPRDERRVNRIRDFFVVTRSFRVSVGQVLVLSLLLQAVALLSPLYIQLTVDQGLSRRDTDLVLVIALAFLMMVLVRTVLTWLRGLVLIYLSNSLGLQMVTSFFHHLIRLPVSYFERRHMGDIVSRFGAINNIRQLVSHELIAISVDGLFSIATLVLLYLYSPLLASIGLVFILVYVAIRLLILPIERVRRQELIAAEASQQSVFMENVRSIMVTKLYTTEQHRSALWQANHVSMINRGVRLERVQLLSGTLQVLLFGVDHVLTIYFGTRLVYAGELSIGQLLAFIFLKQHFISSVSDMLPRLIEWRLLRLQLERVADITMTDPEFDDLELPLLPRPMSGTVSMQAVVFSYPGHDRAVLNGLSLRVAPGECVAVTGPSGCGKSTVLKLLAGLLEPDQGLVCVDGVPLHEFGVRDYRRRIAAVLHGDTLLSGTVRDNIVLDDEQPQESHLWHCCELCGIAADIRQMPMGMLTPVGDMSSTLSAGQVQRLLLARAMYRRPGVLFLDEAMANLDVAQAQHIMRALRKSGAGIVMVSHNPGLIDETDRQISLAGSGCGG